MQKNEMLNILEALANNVDIETGEVLDLNDRIISALYKALYELKSFDINSTITNSTISKKSTNLIKESISQLDENDRELFEILREYRNDYSRENGYRAYTLGSNRALLNMVYQKPTKDTFLEITGVGKFINDNFADGYTSLIKKHLDTKKINSSNLSQTITEENHLLKDVSSLHYFKIENYPSVRLFNKQWTGNIDHINKLRQENIINNRFLNNGLPFTIEEAELFNQWIEQGKTLAELRMFFQRNIKNMLPKTINRTDYRIFYFKDLAKKKIIDNPCIDCESEIPQARLENVENAIRCASCQEKYELDHPESISRKAAENPIGSREDFKSMSNKQFGTNIKSKF
jgi:hypothetical protein